MTLLAWPDIHYSYSPGSPVLQVLQVLRATFVHAGFRGHCALGRRQYGKIATREERGRPSTT